MPARDCPPLSDLFATSDGRLLIGVGAGIFQSRSPGKWETKILPTEVELTERKRLRAICGTSEGSTLWAVGSGWIIRSTDSGATWTVLKY